MSNETQQTVVDKIVTLLNKKGFSPVLTEEEIKFFKEMEKEQMWETASYYYHECGNLTPTQYYNETYGGDK